MSSKCGIGEFEVFIKKFFEMMYIFDLMEVKEGVNVKLNFIMRVGVPEVGTLEPQ